MDEMFVKINGVRHYLWRAVDHEGEMLESVVTKRCDKHTALKMLRKFMRPYCQPEILDTDRFASCKAALSDLVASVSNRADAGSTTAPRITICHSDDGNEPNNGFGACKVYIISSQFTLLSSTISTRIVASPAVQIFKLNRTTTFTE